MKTKFFLLAALTVLCATTAIVFTACSSEENNPDMYTYSVEVVDMCAYSDTEHPRILNEMNLAVGKGSYSSNADDKGKKSACQKVLDKYKDNPQSVYLKFALYQIKANVDNPDVAKEIATFEHGKALTTSYATYNALTDADEVRSTLIQQRTSYPEDIYKASSRTLIALNTAFNNLNVELKKWVYRDKDTYGSFATPDTYLSAKCDSILDAHANDTLCIATQASLSKTGVRSKEVTEVWKKTLPINIPE